MKKIAVFDFDETLVEENSLSHLFKFLLGERPLFLHLFPILVDYRTYGGQVKSVIKQTLYKKALEGQQIKQVYQAGRVAANKLTQITDVVDRLIDLNKQGVDVWIITASPESFIQGVIDELQWPVKRVIGTLLESNNGVLNGLVGEECQKQEKVRRFNDIIEKQQMTYNVLEGYGNLPVDIPMLSLAAQQFYVDKAKLSPYINKE